MVVDEAVEAEETVQWLYMEMEELLCNALQNSHLQMFKFENRSTAHT